ncbi:MAG: S-layer homology domain-containing protein [Clostridiales bacterium]|nr:S-layer homology domain-containing protein [Clostridiales bacterium]
MKNFIAKKTVAAFLGILALCLPLIVSGVVSAEEKEPERIYIPAGDRVTSKIQKYPDVPQSHWASTFVMRLTYEGAITGYPDGAFGPERSITRAEFVALTVGALQGRPQAPPAGQHWAANIIQAAEDNGLLEAGEFAPDTWNTPIIRQEMAKIMTRATQYVQKEAPVPDTGSYTANIADFADISESYRPYIAQAYAKGLVTGYPDGSFGGGRQATRAEASTMLVRLLDPCYRLREITFDPAADVAADGRMKLAKAEQYLMKNLRSLRFYMEGGKFYFEGEVAEVPEGFKNNLNIAVEFKKGSGLPIASYSSYPFKTDMDLPDKGTFKEEIKGMNSLDQINYVQIIMMVEAPGHTNKEYDKKSFEILWSFYSIYDNRINVFDYIEEINASHKFYDFSQIFQW